MKRIWAGLVGALLGAPAVAQESEASPYRSWTLRDVRVTTQDIFDEDEVPEEWTSFIELNAEYFA